MSTDQNDSRPPVWVGHVSMATSDLAESQTFMEQLGMRPMFRNESVAIFELRGGTHLVLVADANARPGERRFEHLGVLLLTSGARPPPGLPVGHHVSPLIVAIALPSSFRRR